jgi:hypothetical protein
MLDSCYFTELANEGEENDEASDDLHSALRELTARTKRREER